MTGYVFAYSLDSWTRESRDLCFKSMLSENKIPQLIKTDILNYRAERMEEDNYDDTEMMDTAEDDGEIGDLPDSERRGDGTTSQEVQIEEALLLKYAEEKYFYAGGCVLFM